MFFAWCVSREAQRAGIRLAANPSISLSGKHYAESKGRTRFLSADEIGWLLRALDREAQPYRRLFLLLLLTGARRGEAAAASRYSNGVWTITAEQAKNGIPLDVRLGPIGQQVFESPSTGDTSNINRAMRRIHARMESYSGAPLERWTPHDLRRTLRSNTFSLGITFEVAEAMLNHARQGLERRYDASDLSAQMAAGWLAWERHIAGIAEKVGVAIT